MSCHVIRCRSPVLLTSENHEREPKQQVRLQSSSIMLHEKNVRKKLVNVNALLFRMTAPDVIPMSARYDIGSCNTRGAASRFWTALGGYHHQLQKYLFRDSESLKMKWGASKTQLSAPLLADRLTFVRALYLKMHHIFMQCIWDQWHIFTKWHWK